VALEASRGLAESNIFYWIKTLEKYPPMVEKVHFGRGGIGMFLALAHVGAMIGCLTISAAFYPAI
jgi:hypothetical protein